MNQLSKIVAVLACTGLVALTATAQAETPAAKAPAAPAAAAPPPAAAAPVAAMAPKASPAALPTQGGFADLRPSKVLKGNAKVPEIRKTRGAEGIVPASKDLLVGWFEELKITHNVDDKGRIILPFRDDASGLNLNLVLVPRFKPSGAMWAVQALVGVAVPVPAGPAGLQKAVTYSNAWNIDSFLIKAQAAMPEGSPTFIVLDATMLCEAGISKAEFFQNFVGVMVHVAQGFVSQSAQAMSAP